MNARNHEYEISLENSLIEEAITSVFHTVLFHRTFGKILYKAEGSYTLGSVGSEDVDCENVDLTYVRVNCPELDTVLRRDIRPFSDALRRLRSEGGDNNRPSSFSSSSSSTSRKSGQISLEFYQKHRRNWPFGEIDHPWEIWTMKLDVVPLANESELQRMRESVGEALSDVILNACSSLNRHDYVPKMPVQSELGSVFDVRFPDIQPYLFRVAGQTSTGSADGSGASSAGVGQGLTTVNTVKKLIKDTLIL